MVEAFRASIASTSVKAWTALAPALQRLDCGLPAAGMGVQRPVVRNGALEASFARESVGSSRQDDCQRVLQLAQWRDDEACQIHRGHSSRPRHRIHSSRLLGNVGWEDQTQILRPLLPARLSKRHVQAVQGKAQGTREKQRIEAREKGGHVRALRAQGKQALLVEEDARLSQALLPARRQNEIQEKW